MFSIQEVRKYNRNSTKYFFSLANNKLHNEMCINGMNFYKNKLIEWLERLWTRGMILVIVPSIDVGVYGIPLGSKQLQCCETTP